MGLILKILGAIFLIMVLGLVFFYTLGAPKRESVGVNVEGLSPQKVCEQVYYALRNNPSLSMYDQRTFEEASCVVGRLPKSLPGKFAVYTPYSVTYSNAVAARVANINGEITIVGWSTSGPLQSWFK